VAHVEAPTFGRIILAGILLKLGGVGLIKINFLLGLKRLQEFRVFFLWAFIYRRILCFLQTDFKKVIAFSRIFHIRTLPLLVSLNTIFAEKAIILIIVLHGLISPALFLLVGVRYSLIETRNLTLIRSLFYTVPTLTFLARILFIATLPAPPFYSFVREIFLFFSLTPTFRYNLGILGLGAFFKFSI